MTDVKVRAASDDVSEELAPISMVDAVGYAGIECAHETPVAGALVLKHDRDFLLVNQRGDVVPPGRCGLGLFHDDTRVLSHYALRVSGAPPLLLSSQVPGSYRAQIDLAINDLEFGGNSWDPKNCIHIRRELLLEDRLYETLTLTNYLNTPVDLWTELLLAADFADLFEVRGWRREGRGQYYAAQVEKRIVRFSYRGRDGALVQTAVEFAERPGELRPDGARWTFRLDPDSRLQLEWQVRAERTGGKREFFPSARLDDRRVPMEATYQKWRASCATWRSNVETLDDTLRHAVDDLRALYLEGGQEGGGGPIITAGIPWYSTAFGRDSVITSLQTLPLNSRVAVDTLRYLARHQGKRENPFTEEQPGKIMHELRRGEMARSGEIPHIPYYGTIDATPLWLVLLHETWRWTGDDDLVRELLPHARQALEWIDRYGDLDGDGFVEYARTSAKGLVNQGWKDSSDGVPWPDGRLPTGPIALVEVQGYVADAKFRMGALFEAFGDAESGARLREEATQLRDAIRERFWLDELGIFALALDGAKQPIPTITSNAGHLLWSRVPTERQAARMAEVLTAPQMVSGWGLRTLSAVHPVFNPMSYHNGSVWPHDNALVVLGLAFNGHIRAALPILTALHEAAIEMPFRRLPELFCGMQRAHGMRPVLYPVSCSPQAWASGAMFMLLQAVTGILPEAPARVLHVRNPQLPTFLDELTINGLRVGGSRVSLRFHRHGARTLASLLGVEGDPLQVRIELSG